MNIKDYEFHIGNEVITIEGEKGTIVDICDCDMCQKRCFNELFWGTENEDLF